jgi:3-phenylpropionate/trans-cinnamate dioxygenase ferredoxin reductase subunit
MTNYKYLIVGAGMTADAAARGIRELDPNGEIGMIGDDHNPPYNRPP